MLDTAFRTCPGTSFSNVPALLLRRPAPFGRHVSTALECPELLLERPGTVLVTSACFCLERSGFFRMSSTYFQNVPACFLERPSTALLVTSRTASETSSTALELSRQSFSRTRHCFLECPGTALERPRSTFFL
ncbi:hypothetical protein AVEN_220383-1 [Araneus ventricosus]|uniref:Uncharacterized protein n=1 Tax=Araneus ventricosus TaxID=182803 RepID=A0A4Y2SD63_ARAVE|nr:hypothetical protein AVEN_220383-1 [Araneus ventricosus]